MRGQFKLLTFIFRLLGQFQSGYATNLERYCMKNFGLDSSHAESFAELANPRVAAIFLEKMGSVSIIIQIVCAQV